MYLTKLVYYVAVWGLIWGLRCSAQIGGELEYLNCLNCHCHEYVNN